MRRRASARTARISSSPMRVSGRHGSIFGEPARLDLPQIPDPGDGALVEQRVAEAACGVLGAYASERQLGVELRRADIGPEARQARMRAHARGAQQVERGAAKTEAPPRDRRVAPPRPHWESARTLRRGRGCVTRRSFRDGSGGLDRPRSGRAGACRAPAPPRSPARRGARPTLARARAGMRSEDLVRPPSGERDVDPAGQKWIESPSEPGSRLGPDRVRAEIERARDAVSGRRRLANLPARAPVAQLDRASVYGTEGLRFES